jgi:hypothetical protein
MVLSQPPSCDTVPFRVRYSNTDLAAPFDWNLKVWYKGE